MRATKYIYYFIQPRRLNILFHSLSHSVPLSLSLSLSLIQLSSSTKTLSISQAFILSQSLSSLTVTLLSHRHSLNLPHSPPPARPNHPKPPITSPSLSSLIVTLSSSLIHYCRPDSSSTSPPLKLDVTNPPVVPSRQLASNPRRRSPQTHFSSTNPLQVKMVGALLPSPPFRNWVVVVLARGLNWLSLWLCLLVNIGYLTDKPMELTNPFLLLIQLADVVLVCDWWFCLVWVEEKDWRFGLVFFFLLLWTSGGGGCGCDCDCGWW